MYLIDKCGANPLPLFGATGNCVACNKVIPAFEMVMRAKSFVYHLECFACQQCNHRFCVGDRFYLCDNKILCEYDYEERLVFASMAANPTGLAHIRRQVSGLQSPSGGYVGGAACAGNPAALVEKDNGGCAGADDASSGYGSPPDPDVCDAAR
ncbi:unnamed protein product [Pieris macdunnoughi]|uniref:LIM zinc-binding domain-containing protein n=1 Tax=Pieris macdunnoughi TaxID=345717 RepID=A0A821X625_9NEOP|nr:unnamed protein product [Pieris macdunnoughi]